MADYFVAVVRLDPLDAPAIDELASALETWLVGDGVITANARYDKLWRPSSWIPGPRWPSVVDDPAAFPHFVTESNNGVDVVPERELHHPHQNVQSPTCPTCSAAMEEDAYRAHIEGWLAGDEPTAQCSRCGGRALLGDWPTDWGYAVGAPAVVFNNWPPLQDGFLASLRGRLGGRSYVVRARI